MPENDKPTRIVKIQNLQEELKHIVNISLRIQLLSFFAGYDPKDMEATFEMSETDLVGMTFKRKEPRYANQQAEASIINEQERKEEYPIFLTLKAGIDVISEYLTQNADNTFAGFFIGIRRAELTDKQVQVLYIPTLAVFYYLALHPEIDPRGQGVFDVDENKAGLLEAFAKMYAFYKANRDFFQDEQAFLTAFLEQVKPKGAEEIRERIIYQTSTNFSIVTDKLAKVFFAEDAQEPHNTHTAKSSKIDLEKLKKSGIPVKYENRNSKKEINLYYDLIYDDRVLSALGIEKGFSEYDFLVSAALDNLKEQGNTQVTLTKIWHEMGNTGSPNAKNHLSELVKSIQKGLSTTVVLDDTEVMTAWGKDKSHQLLSPVMPVQMLKEKYIANGQIVDAIVNITGFSPFYIIGRSINHISTWDKDILKLYPGKRTKRYYKVLRFLTSQIGWLRNEKSKRSNKILYETLYKETGADTTKAQKQTLDMFYRMIDTVFIPTGYVTRRVEDTNGKPGVIITVSKIGKRQLQS